MNRAARRAQKQCKHRRMLRKHFDEGSVSVCPDCGHESDYFRAALEGEQQ